MTAIDLHTIRKEFLKRVFAYYIVRHGAGREDSDGRLTMNDDAHSE